jgi:hypothetical protein
MASIVAELTKTFVPTRRFAKRKNWRDIEEAVAGLTLCMTNTFRRGRLQCSCVVLVGTHNRQDSQPDAGVMFNRAAGPGISHAGSNPWAALVNEA